MVNNEDKGFHRVVNQLNDWLEDVKQHEVTQMVEFIEKAKQFTLAAEALPEERITQFIDNLKYDLTQFHQQLNRDRSNSVYLGLMSESWWATLADMTDKSQVEWAELTDDFAHDGIYQSGDYIGFGQLECQQCNNSQVITHFCEVIDCPECGHHQFTRKALSP